MNLLLETTKCEIGHWAIKIRNVITIITWTCWHIRSKSLCKKYFFLLFFTRRSKMIKKNLLGIGPSARTVSNFGGRLTFIFLNVYYATQYSACFFIKHCKRTLGFHRKLVLHGKNRQLRTNTCRDVFDTAPGSIVVPLNLKLPKKASKLWTY